MQNAKHIAIAVAGSLAAEGIQPQISLIQGGRLTPSPNATRRKRPRRIAKRLGQRHGYVNYILSAEGIKVAGGNEYAIVVNGGYAGYGFVFAEGKPWPQAAYNAIGIV